MMHIIRKYEEKYRQMAQDGDILLCRNNRWLGRKIQKYDYDDLPYKKRLPAYYTHSLRIFKKFDRIFIIDAIENGVHPEFASIRMKRYTDFCVLRFIKTPEEINKAMAISATREEMGIKYDFKQIFKIYLYAEWNINTYKQLADDTKKDIYSEDTWYYSNVLGIKCYEKANWKRPFFTPQDFLRLRNQAEVQVLLNDVIY